MTHEIVALAVSGSRTREARTEPFGISRVVRLFQLLLLALAKLGVAQELGREPGLPLLLSVPTPPTAVRADGKTRLVYELHIVNTGTKSVRLQRVEVLGLSRIADLDEEAIPASLKHTGDDGNRRALIGPGRHAVILLWLTADLPPQNLTHRLTGLIGEEPEPAQTRLSPIPVLTGPVRLRPPVRGEGWVALNGPSNETHHRRSWLAFDGQARVPQRFAIDFIRVNPEGQQFSGDPAKNWSYLCYGAEALTVADGVIEAVRDGIGEGTPGQPPRIRMTKPDDMEGNYVSLRLGSGRLAIDAHLIPGSIRVRRGERVQAGQVLGLIGNSGNSTGPHLHFQVGTGPTVLSGDGLPFVFDAFYHDRELRREEIPLRDWLLHFP